MVDAIAKLFKRNFINRYVKKKVKQVKKDRIYVFIDGKGRLVTLPYSEANMHVAAHGLRLKREYFEGKYYQVPAHEEARVKQMVDGAITSKQLVGIVEGVVQLEK